MPRVGVLWQAGSAEEEGENYKGMIEGFRSLGYVDGQNIVLDHRFPNEVPEQFARMAAELVAQQVDVLIAAAAAGAQAAKRATTTIPIIFMYVADPIGAKLVESLARPGGNVTGLSNYSADLTGLRLQFLKEIVPTLTRVAFLVDPHDYITPTFVDQAQTAAAQFGITVQVYQARTLEALESTFNLMAKDHVQALSVSGGGLLYKGRASIARLALAHRIPTCGPVKAYLATDGILMSYGANHAAISRRAPFYVDKILRGARPADLPVEIPKEFELLINARTAKALSVKIPKSLLIRANDVLTEDREWSLSNKA